MKRKLNAVASVSMLGTLLGCAQLMPGAPVAGSAAAPSRAQAGGVPVKVATAPAVTPAMPSHEALYTMGRAAHGAGQLTLAAQHYEQVLEKVPAHVGALNALAVIHAQSDRTDKALQLFARARQLAPGAAHVHNNTGYALLRAGQLDEAELALKRAHELDPLNGQTLQNLELLATAQAERRPANPVALAGQASADPRAGPHLVVVAPNVYELQAPARPAAGAVQVVAGSTSGDPSQAQALSREVMPNHAPAAAGAGLRGVRLEVSNGVGIANLARRTANRLAVMGVATARLTNARPYRQQKTEIQFVMGQELAAQALQSRLPMAAPAVPASRLNSGTQLRLVLGHDVAGKAIAAWLDAGERPVATATQGGGWRWS
ncbi:MAG: tetratricopeptide repeat protein [Polaromonas sp.]